MTEIIFCGTPRVRSRESYALVRSLKHTPEYLLRSSFLPCQLLYSTNHEHHIGGRTVPSETTLFRQDTHALALLPEAVNDYIQQYLTGVRYKRDASVVAALCPILLFVEYNDDGIFPLLRPPPSANTDDDIEQSPSQSGVIVELGLEQLNGDSVRSGSLSIR